MTDLAAWLLEQIAEDERVARSLGKTAETHSELIPSCEAPHYQHDGLIWITATRVLAECEAKRRIVENEATIGALPEWTPDCGGDWCLSIGALSDELETGAFANYWPDNTVSASVYVDGKAVIKSGIVARRSRAECQAFAEQWVRRMLPVASPVLRLLALPYADRPGYREEWKP